MGTPTRSLRENKSIIISKGVLSNTLTIDDFKKMLYNKENVAVNKTNTITNFEKSSVLIENISVTLNHNAFFYFYLFLLKNKIYLTMMVFE